MPAHVLPIVAGAVMTPLVAAAGAKVAEKIFSKSAAPSPQGEALAGQPGSTPGGDKIETGEGKPADPTRGGGSPLLSGLKRPG